MNQLTLRDALDITASYGPMGADINEEFQIKCLLRDEVLRLRYLHDAGLRLCRQFPQATAAPESWPVSDPSVDKVHLDDVRGCLRDLMATIELHTDCMDGRIDRAALDTYIERAEDLLGETIEEIIK